jgi:hypothetical protein
MTSPESLCAQVLKGKYFPNGDFMTARNKRNSSHNWQSILSGRKALQCGLIRQISNDETANVWQDRWIPGAILAANRSTQNQVPRSFELATSYLLMVGPGMMIDEVLENNLLHMDAQAVKRIPLGRDKRTFGPGQVKSWPLHGAFGLSFVGGTWNTRKGPWGRPDYPFCRQ